MNILIFGAGGFIGSNLVEHLLSSTGHTIVGLDSSDEKIIDLSSQYSDRFSFHKSDIGDDSTLVSRLVRQADVVLDLIAYANPSVYVTRPLDVVELNFFQNLKLVEECLRAKRRLIQFSSSEVYGISHGNREPFHEDKSNLIRGPIKKQRWIYACAKELLERMIVAHGQEDDLEFTIVRPFNFVGPKIDYLVDGETTGGPRVFSHFMSALLLGTPMRLVNGGKAHRSYTHISDAVRAVQLLIENPEGCRNQIVNIGNPRNGTTIEELAYLMKDLYEEITQTKSRSSIEPIEGSVFYGEGYEDCDWRIPDVEKITSLGWEPALDLRETFKRTMTWYIENVTSQKELPPYLRLGVSSRPVVGKR